MMKIRAYALLTLIVALAALPVVTEARRKPKPPKIEPREYDWPSEVPEGCPFPQSEHFAGVRFFFGQHKVLSADGWRLSWTADGRIFGSWSDGRLEGVESCCTRSCGIAELTGDNPMNLRVKSASVFNIDPTPHEGRYLCGSIIHKGIIYYGTYGLDQQMSGWDIMGPLIGFHVSRDFGKTWKQGRRSDDPLFGETSIIPNKTSERWAKCKRNLKGANFYIAESIGLDRKMRTWGKVKVGAAYFVDFGAELEHSPDGKAYLIAQGSTRAIAYNSSCAADQAYLLRVTLTPETINDPDAYEFFAGHDESGEPKWTKDFCMIQPVAEWNDHMGTLGLTYIPQLKRYFMCVTNGNSQKESTEEYQYNTKFDTYILESDKVTGPWKMVTYMKHYGPQAYFTNLLSQYASEDGRTLWMLYGANCGYYRNRSWEISPPGSRYGGNFQKLRLLTPDEVKAEVKDQVKDEVKEEIKDEVK